MPLLTDILHDSRPREAIPARAALSEPPAPPEADLSARPPAGPALAAPAGFPPPMLHCPVGPPANPPPAHTPRTAAAPHPAAQWAAPVAVQPVIIHASAAVSPEPSPQPATTNDNAQPAFPVTAPARSGPPDERSNQPPPPPPGIWRREAPATIEASVTASADECPVDSAPPPIQPDHPRFAGRSFDAAVAASASHETLTAAMRAAATPPVNATPAPASAPVPESAPRLELTPEPGPVRPDDHLLRRLAKIEAFVASNLPEAPRLERAAPSPLPIAGAPRGHAAPRAGGDVRIGQIDVVVASPPQPVRTASSLASSSTPSRRYLRNL